MSSPLQFKVGKALDQHYPNDAIHVGVFTATAEYLVFPGDSVKLVSTNPNVVTPCSLAEAIGIVDPFLNIREDREKEDIYCIFLMPNTAQNMRHAWEHPSFDEQIIEEPPELPDLLDHNKKFIFDTALIFGVNYDAIINYATDTWNDPETKKDLPGVQQELIDDYDWRKFWRCFREATNSMHEKDEFCCAGDVYEYNPADDEEWGDLDSCAPFIGD